MKFSIKDFSSKCDQILSFLRIWSHLLEKSLMENFIFCAVRPAETWSKNYNTLFLIPLNYLNLENDHILSDESMKKVIKYSNPEKVRHRSPTKYLSLTNFRNFLESICRKVAVRRKRPYHEWFTDSISIFLDRVSVS